MSYKHDDSPDPVSAPVLHDHQCELHIQRGIPREFPTCRCAVRAVTAERDAALAEVARMQPVVEAAMRWGPERRNQVTPCAREDCDECVLIDAVLAYRAKAGEEPK